MMNFLNLTVLGVWALIFAQRAHSLSNITFYSDDSCRDIIGEKNGPNDGFCTSFPTEASNFRSFRVTSLDQTCAVTIYSSDIPYCSSSTLSVAPFPDCMTNTTVNQFSVDCQNYNLSISSEPQLFTGEAPGTSTAIDNPSSSGGGGLSAGAKAGIAVGAAIAGIALVVLLVFLVLRNNKRKRKYLDELVPEADSKTLAPTKAELAALEKKNPVELPPQAMIPVEVAGDHQWPNNELEGSLSPSSDAKGRVYQGGSEIDTSESSSNARTLYEPYPSPAGTTISNTLSPVSDNDERQRERR